MKRSWTISRQPQPVRDAETRWDRAFQLLLQCAEPSPRPLAPAPAADHEEEIIHESRTLCTRLDWPPSVDPID